MKRKLLSVLLCLCLICCLLSGGVLAAHTCVDENGDFWCDLESCRIDHNCIDIDADGKCNYCGSWIPHDCISVDGDCLCDVCSKVLKHICFDEDGNYYCDFCFDQIAHECIDENNDYDCDLCNGCIYHQCIDKDYNCYCELCGHWMQHECYDDDKNDFCDYCGYGIIEYWALHLSVTSYLDNNAPITMDVYDDSGSLVATLFLYGNRDTEIFDIFPPAHYTYTLNKDSHVPLSGEFYIDNPLTQLDLEIFPIGDANQDGKLTVGDAARIYSHLRGHSLITNEYLMECADVSGDGKLTVGDTAKVYAHIRGTKPLF